MKALIISADQFEDVELLAPQYRLLEAGWEVTVAAPTTDPITGKKGYEVAVDRTVAEIDPAAFDLLVLPGGKAPAVLREDTAVQAITQHFMDGGKPVAAICHGPEILVAADRVRGRTLTGHADVREAVPAAGGDYVDEEVVVDGNLVTSRVPRDIPAWLREVMALAEV
ncbi:type 1 glutamine amidotransferase domain-containing protein [Thiohalospira sp.]|uniref:type 1 glutamine amidotransferase domain-containing protein n=1 Tax=Thiohalospira sp. TaxID=3080549 RepID=UPI00397ECAE5